MNVKQLFALTALALAAGTALADGAPGTPLTRAEVRQSVLDARANGTLRHAGEIAPEEMTPEKMQLSAPSTTTRAQEKASVLEARADGKLVPAGEGSPADYQVSPPSTLTRAQVRAEVLQARADGTLIPAGQGEFSVPEGEMHVAHKFTPTSQDLAMHDGR
jgi:hypothetical protein